MDLHSILMKAHKAADYLKAKQAAEPSESKAQTVKEDPSDDVVEIQKIIRKPAMPEVQRTAMGEYIPPPGGKPLTSLCESGPAPSDYLPKLDLVKTTAPQYSLVGPHRPDKTKHYPTGPGDRDIGKNLVWRDKSIAIKGRSWPSTIKGDVKNSAGPSSYMVDYYAIGSQKHKTSIKSRPADGIQPGPPNIQVQPVDTKGFVTPGPVHKPSESLLSPGRKSTFGIKPKLLEQDKKRPGPADYTMPELHRGPAAGLGPKIPATYGLSATECEDSPGPASYVVPSLFGDAPTTIMNARPEFEVKDWVPAPNLYLMREDMFDKNSAVMTYRPFESELVKPMPGPNQYKVNDKNLRHAPTFSYGKKVKPSYPTVLHYPTIAQKNMSSEPSPASYVGPDMQFDKGQFSMGVRLKSARNDIPGPGHYKVAVSCRPDAHSAPAYSLKGRSQHAAKGIGPGPAAYYPSTPKSNVAYSITNRPKPTTDKKIYLPAPNQYKLPAGVTSKGTSSSIGPALKSRHSPWVYSGIRKVSGT